MQRSANFFYALARGVFLVTVFLTPLAVLPWLAEPFEMAKHLVLVVGTLLSASSLLVAMLLERRSLARPDAVTVAFGGFVVATGISAVFSLAPAMSWMGQGSQEYMSVLTTFAFFVLFLLAKTFFAESRMALWMLVTIFVSAAVLGLWVAPTFFGINIGILGNLLAVPHVLAIYLLTISVFGMGFWLVDTEVKGWFAPGPMMVIGVSASVTFIATLVLLLALDSTVLWLLALVGMIALFAIAVWHADHFPAPIRFAPMMLVFVLALLFVFLPTGIRSPFLPEVSPNLQATWSIANGAWNDGSIAWGTGPGTFSFAYAKYATTDINQTDFWDIVFDRGNAHVTTMLATHGVVGVLVWIAFVLMLFTLAVRHIAVASDGWKLTTPIFGAWFVVTVAAFVYTQNLGLAFLFWLLSALLASSVAAESSSPLDKGESKRGSERGPFLLAALTIVVLTATTVTLLVTTMRFTAEVAFAKALKQSQSIENGQDMDDVIALLDKAAVRNRWNDVYARNLAEGLLRRLSLLTPEEASNGDYVGSLLKATLATSVRATELSPSNVTNWEVRGHVHRDLLSVIPEAETPAVSAYEQAVQLAPINPRIRVALAQTYIAIADTQTPYLDNADEMVSEDAKITKEESLQKAEEHLRTAVTLKPDYAPAHYYLALLQERQGKLAEAVRSMKAVSEAVPDDVGVGLQLGLLYLRQGKNDLAETEFKRILELAPAYANAHWYLAFIYEQRGEMEAAIAEIQEILVTDPDNVTVKNRLERLQNGIETSEIPEPVVPPTP